MCVCGMEGNTHLINSNIQPVGRILRSLRIDAIAEGKRCNHSNQACACEMAQ